MQGPGPRQPTVGRTHEQWLLAARTSSGCWPHARAVAAAGLRSAAASAHKWLPAVAPCPAQVGILLLDAMAQSTYYDAWVHGDPHPGVPAGLTGRVAQLQRGSSKQQGTRRGRRVTRAVTTQSRCVTALPRACPLPSLRPTQATSWCARAPIRRRCCRACCWGPGPGRSWCSWCAGCGVCGGGVGGRHGCNRVLGKRLLCYVLLSHAAPRGPTWVV